MNILIGIGHPGHVHFFKNFINESQRKGHKVFLIARDKEVTISLIKKYGYRYALYGKHQKNLFFKMIGMPYDDGIFLKHYLKFRPDILLGINDYSAAHIGRLTGTPSIIFTDTENVKFGDFVTFPFASAICTPESYAQDLGKKQVRYNGYHELAYLHPNYFTPDPSVLQELGIRSDEKIIVLRLISWAASHDIGLTGIGDETELTFIRRLEKFGRVVITSERDVSKDMQKYIFRAPPDKIHSLLYYAHLYIGEGGTMASESAILGTPSIHIEGTPEGVPTGTFSGNFRELRDRYDLMYFYADAESAIDKAYEILNNPHSKDEWSIKRKRLLEEKIDVTKWMIDFIETYPVHRSG